MPVVKILIDELEFSLIKQQAQSSNVEIGGMLIGFCERDETADAYSVYITNAVSAKHVISQPRSIQFTPATWKTFLGELQYRFPHKSRYVVGWYHSHPNSRAFFSALDLSIHRGFFGQAWHVALVIDVHAPCEDDWAFFSWAVPPHQIVQVPRIQVETHWDKGEVGVQEQR